MTSANLEIVFDGDGHVMEDEDAIFDLMPAHYKETRGFFRGAGQPMVDPGQDLFPPLDHLHSSNLHSTMPGAFQYDVNANGWMAFMDDVGIDTAVLYTTKGLSFGKIVSRDWAIDLARAYNDWLYEAYIKRSPRFKGIGLIPLQDPEVAVEELRRVVEDLGFCGAMLPSTGVQANLSSKQYWPIYAEASRLGCALSIHGGAHEGLGMDDLTPYAPVHALGHPFGQMIAFAGIVFNGIFDKFPNVRIGFLESGIAWLFTCLERFDRSYQTHVQADPRGEFLQLKDGETISEYVIRQIKAGKIFIGCEGSEPLLAQGCKMVGNEPWFYSSDFPHEVNNEYCKEELREVIENDELTVEDKEAVLYKNTVRFYKLQAPVST